MAERRQRRSMDEITKIVITGLFSALIFGPVGIFIGFNIGEYLNKDNIRIEHIDFLPISKHFTLLQEDYDEVLNSTYLLGYMDYYYGIYGLFQRMVSEQEIPDPLGGFRMQKGLNKREVDTIIDFLDGYKKLKKPLGERFDEFLNKLEKYNEGDNIREIVLDTNDNRIWESYLKNPVDTVSPLLENYRERKKRYLKEDIILDTLMNKLKIFKPDRTGLMEVNIVFLNLGNTDGLVRNDGILRLTDEKEEVKIRLDDPNRIAKIEKRSMLKIRFELNTHESNRKAIDVLKRLLLDGSSKPASIEVKDIRGGPIRSEHVALPVIPPPPDTK